MPEQQHSGWFFVGACSKSCLPIGDQLPSRRLSSSFLRFPIHVLRIRFVVPSLCRGQVACESVFNQCSDNAGYGYCNCYPQYLNCLNQGACAFYFIQEVIQQCYNTCGYYNSLCQLSGMATEVLLCLDVCSPSTARNCMVRHRLQDV